MTAPVRILIIGASGFVGHHLVAALAAEHGSDAVIATGQTGRHGARPLDIRDAAAVRAVLEAIRPSHIFNLSGLAAPGDVRRREEEAWQVHVHAPASLGRLIMDVSPEAWLFHVGSGLAYGAQALHGRPLYETEPLAPLDPYGVTKAAGDLAMGALASQGLRVARLRPFNHSGPRQSEDFAIPAFAAQIARIEAGRCAPVLFVGNLQAARDFLHVEDVVAAYAALLRETAALRPGEIFNIASGTAETMGDLLHRLLELSSIPITVEADPDRQRASDLPTISGDASRLRDRTGWAPVRSTDDMLADVLRHFRSRTP